MIGNYVFELCVLSLLCGVFITLMPKGGIKDISCILCTAILISNILSDFEIMEIMDSLRDENIISGIEEEFSKHASDSERNMKIKVMEQQCKEYILDKAFEFGILEAEPEIVVMENDSSLILPYSLEFRGVWNEVQKQQLSRAITEELGIPEERQVWISGQHIQAEK